MEEENKDNTADTEVSEEQNVATELKDKVEELSNKETSSDVQNQSEEIKIRKEEENPVKEPKDNSNNLERSEQNEIKGEKSSESEDDISHINSTEAQKTVEEENSSAEKNEENEESIVDKATAQTEEPTEVLEEKSVTDSLKKTSDEKGDDTQTIEELEKKSSVDINTKTDPGTSTKSDIKESVSEPKNINQERSAIDSTNTTEMSSEENSIKDCNTTEGNTETDLLSEENDAKDTEEKNKAEVLLETKSENENSSINESTDKTVSLLEVDSTKKISPDERLSPTKEKSPTQEVSHTVDSTDKKLAQSPTNMDKEDSPAIEDSKTTQPTQGKSFATEFEKFLNQPTATASDIDSRSADATKIPTQSETESNTEQNFKTIMAEETSNSSWYKMPENKEDTMDVAKMGLLGDENSNMSIPENASVVSSNIGENSGLSFPVDEGSNLSVPDETSSVQKFAGHQPVFDESANMNPPSNITFAQPGTPSSVNADTTMSESTTPTAKRFRRGTLQQAAVDANEQGHNITAADIFEYQWPQETDADWYILQEQLSVYLDVKSFKRKYPEIFRRVCDKLEKDFLREKGVVTETQSDLGLTALKSDDVHELMGRDYPAKYKEFLKILHEREKKRIAEKLKEYDAPRLEKEKMIEYTKRAMKSASEWNRKMLKERNKERRAYFDMQTFTVHYPKNKFKKQTILPTYMYKTAYPISLIPGQFQEYYKRYTPEELKHFPLNTTTTKPQKKVNPVTKLQEQIQKRQKQQLALQQRVVVQRSIVEEMDTSQPVVENTAGNQKDVNDKAPTDDDTKMVEDKPEDKIVEKLKRREKSSSRETSTEKSAEPTDVKKEPTECRICKEEKDESKKSTEEDLISCSECNRAGHPSCLDLTDEMVKVIKTYPWQCMECKTCVQCMDPYDEDKMLFCDNCDRGYHTFCVGLKSLPTGKWECKSCTGDTTPITPLPKPPPRKRGRKPKDPNAQSTPGGPPKDKEASGKVTPIRLTARRVAMEAKEQEKSQNKEAKDSQ